MAIYPTRDFILLWRAKVDQNIDWKREAKEDKKTNAREKKQRSPLRLINHHKTHTLSYTLYIFKTPWASRSRNCSSASFRRRKCAFWWCVWETFWFFGRLFSGFFLSLSFFLYRAKFVRSFVFVGERAARERRDFWIAMIFTRALCSSSTCRAWMRSARVGEWDAFTCAQYERIVRSNWFSRERRGTNRESRRFVFKARATEESLFRLKILVHFYEREETFFESILVLTLISLFLL
jgi:hypothetical protein